ncbi:MAG: Holliday junction branch migration protein RuvA [Ruminococcaceae bacterium]|nr:Holliday junction branch migration protein RuvA [Oscillospiraceae bacterium]
MFYYLSGKLALLKNDLAVIDVGGVGYKLTISGTTYEAMPANRSVKEPPTIKLFTYLAVREDGLELFGFSTETELATFKLLITVSGVGPKAAMAILSHLTPEKFALAVCTDDKKTISKANGIGPKTAARVILELKDKLMKENGSFAGEMPASIAAVASPVKNNKLAEATDALMVLGYSRAEAMAAMKDMDIAKMELEEIIRLSLKRLM